MFPLEAGFTLHPFLAIGVVRVQVDLDAESAVLVIPIGEGTGGAQPHEVVAFAHFPTRPVTLV
jgi:hypothetical protein